MSHAESQVAGRNEVPGAEFMSRRRTPHFTVLQLFRSQDFGRQDPRQALVWPHPGKRSDACVRTFDVDFADEKSRITTPYIRTMARTWQSCSVRFTHDGITRLTTDNFPESPFSLFFNEEVRRTRNSHFFFARIGRTILPENSKRSGRLSATN